MSIAVLLVYDCGHLSKILRLVIIAVAAMLRLLLLYFLLSAETVT